MASLTTGTMTNLDVQNFQNYVLEIPTVTNVDTYVEGALAWGDHGWGFNYAFYSTNGALYLIEPS